MLIKCTEEMGQNIDDYLSDNERKCLYLYIDYYKYGLNHPLIDLYVNLDDTEIKCLILRYHTGLHLFSAGNEFDVEDVCKKILEINPSMICCVKETIDKIMPYLKNYGVTYGNVLVLDRIKEGVNFLGQEATLDDFNDAAKLLCEDEGIGGAYNVEEMAKQMTERYLQKFARNYILRENGILVSHCSTGGELDDIAVTNGAVTSPECRNRGIGTSILAKVCNELIYEGKKPYSICYSPAAYRMHEKIGYRNCGTWAKLTRKEG